MMRYMKNPSFSQIVAALAAVLFSLQSSRAAVETWNAAGGGNWSVNGNWTPAAAPTQADDAVFGNTGTGNRGRCCEPAIRHIAPGKNEFYHTVGSSAASDDSGRRPERQWQRELGPDFRPGNTSLWRQHAVGRTERKCDDQLQRLLQRPVAATAE